jgi:hypothetical protein
LSIRSTVAIASPVLPARSSKVNVNTQLPVKVYPVALSQVTVSLNHVTIATKSPLVRLPEAGVYSTVAVGGVVSISIVNVAPVVFPAISVTINR